MNEVEKQVEVQPMFGKLLALKSLVTPEPPRSEHAEVEHAHWDAASRTWQPHPQPTTEERAA